MISNSLILRLRRGGGGAAQSSTDFRIIARGPLSLTFTARGTGTLSYSTDGQSWTPFVSGQPTAEFPSGTILYLQGNMSPAISSTIASAGIGTFSATGNFDIAGCPLSMLSSTYTLADDIPAYAFASLFSGCTNVLSARRVTIPTGTAQQYCLAGMFNGCTYLTDAPALPSVNLAQYCYCLMFNYCETLTASVELPSTTGATQAYSYMFGNCTNLTDARPIHLRTLAERVMSFMFWHCENLEVAPELLPTALVDRGFGYHRLFDGCTKLRDVKVHFSAWVTNATDMWLQAVAANGVFHCPTDLPEVRGGSNIPVNWTIDRF